MSHILDGLFSKVLPPSSPPHLGAAHTDDPVHVAVGVVEEGHIDGVFTGGDPVPLGGGVDLEDVGPGAEDRLLPEQVTIRIWVNLDAFLTVTPSLRMGWILPCVNKAGKMKVVDFP